MSLRALSLVLMATSLIAATSAQGTVAQENLRVGNCPIGATSLSDCDTQGYVIRVAIFSAPGLIVAAFFLLAMPMYIIGKYCCNCCGGRKQSPNFCCPADDLSAVYSRGDLVRPRVVIILSVLVAGGAFAWGYASGGILETNLVEFGNGIIAVPSLLQAQLTAMDAALTVRLYDASSNSFSTVALLQQPANVAIMQEANKTLTQMTSYMNEYVGKGQSYVKQYSWIIFVFFGVPLAVLLIGMVFGLCSIRKYGPMILVWICFILGFLVWICHAVFCLSSMVVSDGCTEIHGVAYQQQNVLPALIGCKDSMFAPFMADFNTLRTSSTQQLCNAIKPYCYDSTATPATNVAANPPQVLVCPSPMDCTTVTFGQMSVWMETAFYTDANVAGMDPSSSGTDGYRCSTVADLYSCYLNLCEHDCTVSGGALSDVGKAAKQFWYSYLAARKVSNTIDTMASQYANCDSLLTLMVSPLDPPCKKITTALVQDRQASGLLGLAIIAGIFALAWGAKRFMPLSEEGRAQKEDEVTTFES